MTVAEAGPYAAEVLGVGEQYGVRVGGDCFVEEVLDKAQDVVGSALQVGVEVPLTDLDEPAVQWLPVDLRRADLDVSSGGIGQDSHGHLTLDTPHPPLVLTDHPHGQQCWLPREGAFGRGGQ